MKDKKCLGCGTILQNEEPTQAGYIPNINHELCQRCFKLKNYGEYQKTIKNNQDYKKIIESIDKKAQVLYICDILSLNLDNINKFKNVILVLTKRDILPKSIKDSKIIDYIKKRYKHIEDIEIISTLHNYNLDNLYNKILKYNNKQPIYLVGNTNSGKSTLLNKLIKNYSDQNLEITTSMYPSTTLDKIEIKLNNEITIIDTPGLINENSLINKLPTKELKKYNIKKEIKPRAIQIKDSGSILIDNLIRLDYHTKEANSMTIYINNGVPTKKISINNSILKNGIERNISLPKGKDIVIEDICFIKIVKPIEIDLYTQENIKISIRDNLI